MCSSDAPSPDPRIGEAAMKNAATADEALKWYMAKDAAMQPYQQQAMATADKVAQAGLETQQFNNQQAKTMWSRYLQNSVPVENRMFSDAMNYDSAARQEQDAGRAMSDVAQATSAARDASGRAMMRMGVNPNSGRFAALRSGENVSSALASATAGNNARRQDRDMGIMLRKDAANFGRGMTSTAAQTYGVGMAGGAAATGALTGAINSANQSTQTNGAGFGTAIQGYNSAGSLLNQQYQTQVQASNQDGGLGGALVGAAGNVGAAYAYAF